jgi:hypothetical protein
MTATERKQWRHQCIVRAVKKNLTREDIMYIMECGDTMIYYACAKAGIKPPITKAKLNRRARCRG